MCINTLLFFFFFYHKPKGSKTNNKKREKKKEKKWQWKKQIKTKEINKKTKSKMSTQKKKLCLLVAKENSIKIIVSHFHFYFLLNLGRSSFGGFWEKVAGPYHFSTSLPSHSFFLIFSTLIFSSFSKLSQPDIPLDKREIENFQNYPNQIYI